MRASETGDPVFDSEDVFVLKIQLGTDDTRTPADVESALRQVSTEISDRFKRSVRFGPVYKESGQAVGMWEIQ